MANTSKAKDKVENPEAHFAKPKEVLKDNVLSHDEKKGCTQYLGARRTTVTDGKQRRYRPNAIILSMCMHCSPGKIALIWVKFLVNATNTVRVALHRT